MASARFLDPSSIPLRRQSGGNIWATMAHLTQAVIFVVLLSALTLFFFPVIQKTHDLQKTKAQLQANILLEQQKQDQLQLETEHMKSDQAYIEHIARDKLEMGRPGETVLRFDPYQPESPNAKPITAEMDGDSSP